MVCERGILPLEKAILDRQPRKVHDRNPQGQSLLFSVVERRLEKMVDLLLERGVDVQGGKKGRGPTPLLCAAYLREVELVRALLKHKADTSMTDERGNTALHLAMMESPPYYWEFLHSSHRTSRSQNMESVAKMLLGHQANANALNDSWRTPLYVLLSNDACDAATKSAVKQLLKSCGATLQGSEPYGTTHLHRAVSGWGARAANVQQMLANGTKVDAVDMYRRTPLSVAAGSGNETIVKVLLDSGAHVNARDQNQHTPLHAAASGGHEAVVKALLNYGADINAVALVSGEPTNLV